ncbi:steroidogenic acute regulatory protein-like [Orussus abietinus]|uniref:steroidogenic acute regulatory protein-like n=1 Tax=Orussus abietinus TaxID=222816 RepID=UPI00062512C1|nr:steroidogenic acute regulatory protein-like [Orussus abietinus]XP_012274184.1 steroidogenic acute regulatory protein-like [Orussus abietinus]
MTEDNRPRRDTAESVLNASIYSQRSSVTPQSINRMSVVTEDVIAGARLRGKMSSVRRCFCLFVTVDVLLIGLVWLISIMITGENIKKAVMEEVWHYSIYASKFDYFMLAICRFTILLLFYGLLYLDNTYVIALTSATTIAFLIAKTCVYDWSHTAQPMSIVLILSSFLVVWIEVWYLDKVMSQECQAKDWFQASINSERAPLLGPYLDGVSNYPESTGVFYTPEDSPVHSDHEDNDSKPFVTQRTARPGDHIVVPIMPKLTPQKADEYMLKATAALERAYELLTSSDWVVDKVTEEGDIISTLSSSSIKSKEKIRRITGVVDATDKSLMHRIFDEIDSMWKWYKHVEICKRIQVIDEDTDIVYQCSVPYAGGVISARDFVMLRRRAERGHFQITAGISITHPSIPSRPNFVRGENGVTCWAMEDIDGVDGPQCRFTAIVNTKLNGWIPRKLTDTSMTTIMMETISFLRLHLRTMKNGEE